MSSPHLAVAPLRESYRIVLRRKVRKSMSISARRKLIEVELTKIRGLAEQVDDDHLVYFIDMAISEIETKPDFRNDNKEKSARPMVILRTGKS
jgi:hypothetical protein